MYYYLHFSDTKQTINKQSTSTQIVEVKNLINSPRLNILTYDRQQAIKNKQLNNKLNQTQKNCLDKNTKIFTKLNKNTNNSKNFNNKINKLNDKFFESKENEWVGKTTSIYNLFLFFK